MNQMIIIVIVIVICVCISISIGGGVGIYFATQTTTTTTQKPTTTTIAPTTTKAATTTAAPTTTTVAPTKSSVVDIGTEKSTARLGCLFNAKIYADSYPDLKNAFGYDEDKLRQHYNEFGAKEGRSLCGIFENELLKSSHRDNFCLDVPRADTANGVQLHAWDCHGGDNQLFTYTPNQELKLKHSGKCLDVAVASKDNGGIVHQWDCHGGDNQKWIYDNGQWKPKHAPGKCLDIVAAGKANGSLMQIWDCHGGDNQKWKRDKKPDPLEVYHIGGYNYAKSQGSDECKKYNGRLASRDELLDAHKKGADWCSAGWVSDNTPEAWYPINTPRQGCSESSNVRGFVLEKAGINCYGVKPKEGTANILPFNQTKWSMI